MSTILDVSLLIHLGAALYIAAFLVRDELWLRVLVLAGSGFYILYYFLFPAEPLWDAIITSLILVLANLIVLAQIILERTTLRLSGEEKQLFDAFETLAPGQFRHVAKLAQWKTATDPDGTVMTREAEPSRALFYVFKGVISVDKSGRQFRLPEGNFVGEIAYVLGRETTATTVAPEGVRYVEWSADALRKLSKKKPNLGNAITALLTRDLAKKLSTSYRPNSAMPANSETEKLLADA